MMSGINDTFYIYDFKCKIEIPVAPSVTHVKGT
jgi:hypothetical protein